MNRAYSLIDIKSIKEDERLIEGMATTPSTDRVGDIVEPLGAKFSLPMPLLLHHDATQPVGHVEYANVGKDGIRIKARIAKIDEPGKLKDRLDEAWQSLKAKPPLVGGLSIGFRIKEYEVLKEGGWRIKESEILELSMVTIPANADCTIDRIKSLDAEVLAASGHKPNGVRTVSAGASAIRSTKVVRAQEAKAMTKKTIAENISAFEATRQAKSARMDEIMDASSEKGETLDVAQKEEFDAIEAEVKEIDDHLKRLRSREAINKQIAKPVENNVIDLQTASASRGGVVVQTRRNCEPGIQFVRMLGAKHIARQTMKDPADIAKQMFWDTPEVEMVLRAPVSAGTTTDATWAGPLVYAQNMASEFVDLLAPATIIPRIPGLSRVPFNIRVPRETTGASVNWVGEGRIKPVSAMAFDSISLAFAKVAGIVPITQELMKFSNPAAEMLIRNSLVKAIAYLTDRDFLDPAKAEQSGVSPASITNGATAITATGTTADALRADLGTLFFRYTQDNQTLSSLVLVMTASQAMRIAMMRNTLGQREFDQLGRDGGTLEGIPVVVSENIVSTGGSPADGSLIVAINAPEILVADEGGVTIDVSTEASIQMDTAPDSPATASTITVSAFQYNMVFIRAERFITWKAKRSNAVQYIQMANYVA